MIQSLIIAFSMYSKIPMPKVTWNEKNMRYAMCFFPVVGAVVGIILYGVLWLCTKANFGLFFKACMATLVPILVTGGIHMDGYLDTIDALSSYADQEKRLEILKDSNSGAFAIIYGLVYFTINIAIWTEIKINAILFVCLGYIISRTLSALSVVSFPLAKKTGLVATFQEAAYKKNVKICMVLYFIIEAIVVLALNPILGGVTLGTALFTFGLHYYICKSKFGGITGDLAGFFLQLCELAILAGLMLAAR